MGTGEKKLKLIAQNILVLALMAGIITGLGFASIIMRAESTTSHNSSPRHDFSSSSKHDNNGDSKHKSKSKDSESKFNEDNDDKIKDQAPQPQPRKIESLSYSNNNGCTVQNDNRDNSDSG